jgi:DNA-binding NarL/FixJ family response regulator
MTSSDQITVLVVEDHEFLREGLREFLSLCDDITVIGTAADGEEAIAACEQLRPLVVLMDLHMPVMDGLTATRRIHELYPHIQVIVLTSSYGDSRRQEVFDAGARAYLRKGVTVERIAETIRGVVM